LFLSFLFLYIMVASNLEEAIEHYVAVCEKLELDVSETLMRGVAKTLGPSIYGEDTARVSGRDEDELARVNKYVTKYMGSAIMESTGDLTDEQINGAIDMAIEKMGMSNTNKWRVIFYALIAQHFGCESVFVGEED
jgi:hypothetical protein